MRVLVTGATGGLGRVVVDALRGRGDIVRASGRNRQSGLALREAGIEVALGDLTDETGLRALLEGIDAVVHCAALSSPWGAYRDFNAINLVATQTLLKAASEAGVSRFVFISSPSVYAEMEDRLDLTEQDPIAQPALNAYAATKALAEREVLAANSENMATVILRPRAIVGPHDTVLLPRILKIMETGRFPLLRGGAALVELTDARDVADAVLCALDRAREQCGEIFNISGGRALSVRVMVETLAQALGTPARFITVPLPLAKIVAHACELIFALLPGRPEPPLTRYTLSILAYSQTFRSDKARDRLGFVPRHDAMATAVDVVRRRLHVS
jgi:nucleoside-diphosphate-sugar epimerase